MKWIHLQVTWAQWWVLPNLRKYKLKPCDGFYLMGTIHSDTAGPVQIEAVGRELLDMGFKVIPTAVAFTGTQDISAWYDPLLWRHVGLWCYGLAEQDGDFAVDFEPYWENNRYPSPEWVRSLAVAVKPLIEMVRHKNVKLHLLPGIHYPLAMALASALPGKIVDCDEACYVYGDPARRDELAAKRGKASWDADVLERRKGTEIMGITYRPGFYLPTINDPIIQDRLSQKDFEGMDSWYYPRSEEAQTLGVPV